MGLVQELVKEIEKTAEVHLWVVQIGTPGDLKPDQQTRSCRLLSNKCWMGQPTLRKQVPEEGLERSLGLEAPRLHQRSHGRDQTGWDPEDPSPQSLEKLLRMEMLKQEKLERLEKLEKLEKLERLGKPRKMGRLAEPKMVMRLEKPGMTRLEKSWMMRLETQDRRHQGMPRAQMLRPGHG